MVWKANLHQHSVYSDKLEQTIGGQPYNQACRRATPRRILQSCEAQGLDEIAITDSNGDLFFQRIENEGFFGEGYKCEVLEGNVARVFNKETGKETYFLNGIEFHDNPRHSSGNGHIVVVGHQGSLMGRFEDLDLDERISLAEESNGIWFFPHPCSKLAYGVGEEFVQKYYDKFKDRLIIEGFNSQLLFGRDNKKAKRLAEELRIPALANSDSNSAQVLSYNIFENLPKDRKNGQEHVDYLRKKILQKDFATREKLISPWSFFRDYLWEFGVAEKVRRARG